MIEEYVKKRNEKQWYMCDQCVLGVCVCCCNFKPEDCLLPKSASICEDWEEIDGDWVAKQWLLKGKEESDERNENA